MGKYNFTKNDCFLLRGKDINEPMTVYQITDIDEVHIWAKHISITNKMIYGFPISDQYDNSIPDDAIPLPSNSWLWVRKKMKAFVDENTSYLRDNVNKETNDVVIGGHYMLRPGALYTITEVRKDSISYDSFKIDEDFISPFWTGTTRKNDTDIWYVISDETYKEVIHRYNELLSRLRYKFCR